jgi:hypothetical protein
VIIVGLDLSLTSTGVARLNLTETKPPRIDLDTYSSKPPPIRRGPKGKPLPATLNQRHRRLTQIRDALAQACAGADLVLVEGPSLASRDGHAHDRSGLWWLVMEALHNMGPAVVEVPPSCRMKYATGKGMASKDVVMLAAANRYRDLVEVTGNDVADALLIAAMGARHLGRPIESSLPQTHLAAMDNVHWPA